MFSKISRYRDLPDIVVTDRDGITRESRTHRRLPEVKARFEHVLSDADRPDHVAFKYHQQSRNWWRICDANPDFKSPRELFGDSPIQTSQFAIRFIGEIAPWNSLFSALTGRLGVLSVEKGAAGSRLPSVDVLDDTLLFDIPAALAVELVTSTFAQQMTVPLAAALTAGGLTLSTDISLVKLSAVGWRLKDMSTGEVFSLTEDPGGGPIDVMDTVVAHSWSITVRSNRNNVTPGEIRDQIETLGFEVDAPQARTRIGKSIIVPPPNG